jgi:phosphoglycolate phosphatase-like HAD superfamily hydrolase
MVEAVVFSWTGTLVDDDEEDGRRLAATTHALLETLRRRGVKLAVVAPPDDDDLERLGIADRVDVVAGRFDEALAELAVDPDAAVFVGDGSPGDVRGAGGAGMTTVQAVWFRAADLGGDDEPDFVAFTQMDVLNIVDRLRSES